MLRPEGSREASRAGDQSDSPWFHVRPTPENDTWAFALEHDQAHGFIASLEKLAMLVALMLLGARLSDGHSNTVIGVPSFSDKRSDRLQNAIASPKFPACRIHRALAGCVAMEGRRIRFPTPRSAS